MLLTTLPKPRTTQTPALPEVCSDHFLFYENLEEPYHCPEQSTALGLLMADKGECDYFVNGTKNPVHRSQFFLVNRSSRLAIHTSKKASAPALLFFHSRLPDLVLHSLSNSDEKLLDITGQSVIYDFSYLERIHNNVALTQTIHSLIALGQSCSSFASLKADIMIRNLFEQLLRENRIAETLAKNIAVVKASTRLEIFKRISLAKEWMEAYCCSAISLEQMAVVASMNSQHFLRMFTQVHKTTPHQYLIRCRLEKAKQLLLESGLPVMEICHAIGFESLNSFTLLFRKHFGMPPGRFRKDKV